jgi:3-oxoacyl-[acyl-carrier protein] reductase
MSWTQERGGIGQRQARTAICHALAKEGVHLAVMYAQSREQAKDVARDLTSRHQINAAAFVCDITDGGAITKLVGDVTGRFGRLDMLVNDVHQPQQKGR